MTAVNAVCCPTKECFKCGAEKPLTDFYKHSGMKDGHLNKCKECNKEDVRQNYRTNIKHYKEYDKRRFQENLERRQRLKEYAQSEAGKAVLAKARLKWKESNPEKYQAHTIVNNAVRDGRLLKPNICEDCGKETKLHGHHEDYSKPLDVVWVCPQCHSDHHN